MEVKPWKKMLIYIYICSISHHHHPRSSFSHLNVIFDSPKHACECLEKRLKSCKTFIHSHIVEKSICVCECVYWSRLLYFAHFFLVEIESNMCTLSLSAICAKSSGEMVILNAKHWMNHSTKIAQCQRGMLQLSLLLLVMLKLKLMLIISCDMPNEIKSIEMYVTVWMFKLHTIILNVISLVHTLS